MGLNTAIAASLYILKPSLFPSLTDPLRKISVDWELWKSVLPIAFLFCMSMTLGNSAYMYSSVSFLQMMKEMNVALVYVFSLALSLEKFNWKNAIVLAFIMIFTMMTVRGELYFSYEGFAMQLVACLSESVKTVLQALLLANTGRKLDAMSFVLLVMPMCFFMLTPATWLLSAGGQYPILSGYLPSFAAPSMSDWRREAPWLLASAGVAFTLNVSGAFFVKSSSAITFVLAGLAKDLIIVLVDVVVMKESVTKIQATGFCMQMFFLLLWSLLRTFPEKFDRNANATGKGPPTSLSPCVPASSSAGKVPGGEFFKVGKNFGTC